MRLRQPASLTTLLGMLFALVATVSFAGVGAYLYHALSMQLERRDDIELIGKVEQIRHLLQETDSVQSIREDPHRFIDAATGHDGLILILQAANGETVLKNHSEHGALPRMPVASANRTPTSESLRDWMLRPGLIARTVSAWGRLHSDREQVKIIVARTSSARMALLEAYRRDALTAILAGVLLATVSGYILVRRGLSPVRTIAQQAQSITAQRLETRLDAEAAPKELQLLVAAFNDMLDRLHGSFQKLSQFSADLAHDLRTPINNLMVQTQVALAQSRSLEDYQTLLASNVEEYERLARMVENMLFLARADHDKMGVNLQPLNAASELNRIAEYFEGVAAERQVRIVVQADGTVFADPILFRRAVNNLVANAIRHTPEGGTIRLESTDRRDESVIAVINPGRGIDPEHLPRLFDRFFRVDQARSDSASSAGLGLAIVRKIMDLHGGRSEVESAPEQLTSFRLIFPNLMASWDRRAQPRRSAL